ncbi:MAG: hypothetical protein ACI4KM_00580 [Oscillospiraceae bacterium]
MKKASIILAALLLTSCSINTSLSRDDVASQNLVISDNCSAEISSYADKIQENNYININTDSLKFNCSVPEEIGKYQVICIDGFQDNADLLFKKYIPSDLFDKSNITDDNTSYPYGPIYNDEVNGISVSVGCTGFFSYCRTSDCGVMDNTIPAFSSYVNDSIGNSVSIENALKATDEFAREFTSVSGFPNILKAATVTEYSSDDSNIVEVKYSNLYKSIPIFSMMSSYNELSFEMAVLPAASAFYDIESNTVNEFTVQCGFEDYSTIETYSEIISPEKALDLFSEALSEHLKYDAIGMELVYCPVYIDNVEQSNGITHREAAPWCNACSYDVFELTPYWAVYIDVTPSKEIYGLINCITGEVEFVNNRK